MNYTKIENKIGDDLIKAWSAQDLKKIEVLARQYEDNGIPQDLNTEDPTYPWMFILSTIPETLIKQNPDFIGTTLASLEQTVFKTVPEVSSFIVPAKVALAVLEYEMNYYENDEFLNYAHRPDKTNQLENIKTLFTAMMDNSSTIFSNYHCADYQKRMNNRYENMFFADNNLFDDAFLSLQLEDNDFLKETAYDFSKSKKFPNGLENAILTKLMNPFNETVFGDGIDKKLDLVQKMLDVHVKKCAEENPVLFLKSGIALKMVNQMNKFNALPEPTDRELYFTPKEHRTAIEYIETMQAHAAVATLRQVNHKVQPTIVKSLKIK